MMYGSGGDRVRHLSSIMIIITTICKDVILVLQTKGIYAACQYDGFIRHAVCARFHEDWYR
jgi:hypothetical protein